MQVRFLTRQFVYYNRNLSWTFKGLVVFTQFVFQSCHTHPLAECLSTWELLVWLHILLLLMLHCAMTFEQFCRLRIQTIQTDGWHFDNISGVRPPVSKQHQSVVWTFWFSAVCAFYRLRIQTSQTDVYTCNQPGVTSPVSKLSSVYVQYLTQIASHGFVMCLRNNGFCFRGFCHTHKHRMDLWCV